MHRCIYANGEPENRREYILRSVWTYPDACKSTSNLIITDYKRLRSLLPMLESLRDSNGLTPTALEQHKADVRGDWQSWNVETLAFNMSFIGIDAILRRLHATNIHADVNRESQFIVSVYVHPIVNHIYSVYLQCLVDSPPGHRRLYRSGFIMA